MINREKELKVENITNFVDSIVIILSNNVHSQDIIINKSKVIMASIGRSMCGVRPRIIIMDDAVKKSYMMDILTKNKFYKWINSNILPCIDNDCILIGDFDIKNNEKDEE